MIGTGTSKKIGIILSFIILISIFIFSSVSGNCRQYGCPSHERCMADGVCTSLLIENYCGINGFSYSNSYLEKINCSEEKPLERERLCMQCSGDYKTRRTLSDITNLLYTTTVGISAILLVAQGLKFATSSSSEERKDIKRAILYILMGLILVFLASRLVDYLYLRLLY